jgi:4-hydroxybenzoate polyprenyltransferase
VETEGVRDLWTLTRPRLAMVVLLIPMIGYAWAHWDRALTAKNVEAIPGLLLAWWLLHAGTMWLNAAVDRDEGEVLLGVAVPVPTCAASAGYTALLGAVLAGMLTTRSVGVAVSVAALLSVLYSHPSTLWKGNPFGGPFVNVVGYGILSPYAGWSLVDVALNPRTTVLWGHGLAAIAGTYFMAQCFQGEEDARRGYRTLVVTHGRKACLLAGRWGVGVAFAGAMALCVLGWMPRACLIALPLGLGIDHSFATWLREGGGEERARGLAGQFVLTALVLTLAATGAYAYQMATVQPVAGLGTAAGHPVDRPRLPPRSMRAWEAQKELERSLRVR